MSYEKLEQILARHMMTETCEVVDITPNKTCYIIFTKKSGAESRVVLSRMQIKAILNHYENTIKDALLEYKTLFKGI